MKFIQLPEDLFDPEDTVHRVVVVADVEPDNPLGVAYISENDIIIHVEADRLKERVGPSLEMGFIKGFLLGLHYLPVTKEG